MYWLTCSVINLSRDVGGITLDYVYAKDNSSAEHCYELLIETRMHSIRKLLSEIEEKLKQEMK